MTTKSCLAALAVAATLSAAGCDWLDQSLEQRQQGSLPLAIAQADCADLNMVSAAIELTRYIFIKENYIDTSTGEEFTSESGKPIQGAIDMELARRCGKQIGEGLPEPPVEPVSPIARVSCRELSSALIAISAFKLDLTGQFPETLENWPGDTLVPAMTEERERRCVERSSE